jgi:hypothetical protein
LHGLQAESTPTPTGLGTWQLAALDVFFEQVVVVLEVMRLYQVVSENVQGCVHETAFAAWVGCIGF